MNEGIGSINKGEGRFDLSPAFVVAMTLFIDMTGFGMVIPLLPFYAATFQTGSTALGILVASFSFMQFIFSPVLGRLSDSMGRKPVLLLSILISTASFILFALANSFLVLLLSRIISGMATETAVAQAYMADITSEKGRAKGMGFVGASLGAGFIIGPAIGGSLSVYGFSAPGFAAVVLTLLNLLFVYFFLPESIKKGSTVRADTSSGGGILSKVKDSLTKPRVGPVLLVFFFITLAFSTIPVIMPLLGIAFFGFGAVEMSYFFMYIGLVQIVLQGFFIGRMVNRVGEERLMIFGPFLMMFGMFLMPLIPNIAVFFAAITMISSGNGIIRTVVPSFISKRTHAGEQGGMLGLAQSVSTIARVPGPLIGGSVFEFLGLVTPFLLSAVWLLVAFALGYKVSHSYTHSGQDE